MSTTKHLLETATLVSESADSDGAWKVRVISEGKGSSGTYTATLLENHHAALNNVLSFKNHPLGWDGPQSRDFTMIAGEVKGETWIEKDDRGLTAVFANYVPDPEYKDKLERYKDKLGLSIYIEGSGYEDENGEFIVDWFNPEDPYASLDVVIAPGARGKFMESADYRASLSQMYAAREDAATKPGATSAQDPNERKPMDKEILEAIQALQATLGTLVAEKQTEAEKSAQVEADEKAVEARVSAYDAAVTAIDAAELLPSQVESLRAEARKGKDVAPLIEQAKKVKADAISAVQVTEGAGRDIGSGATSTFGAWK